MTTDTDTTPPAEAPNMLAEQASSLADLVRRSQGRETPAVAAADLRVQQMDEDAAKAAGFEGKLDIWRQIPLAARQKLAHDAIVRQQAALRPLQEAIVTGQNLAQAIEVPDGLLHNPAQFESYVRRQYGEDDYDIKGRRINTFLCDPPPVTQDGQIVPIHPGISRVPLMSVDQKLAQGFSAYPMYPFLPDPDKPCPMKLDVIYGASGGPCPYKGHTDDQVEMHMKAAHPSEYQSMQRRLERERSDGNRDSQTEDRAVMRALMEKLLDEREQKTTSGKGRA